MKIFQAVTMAAFIVGSTFSNITWSQTGNPNNSLNESKTVDEKETAKHHQNNSYLKFSPQFFFAKQAFDAPLVVHYALAAKDPVCFSQLEVTQRNA